MSERDLIDLAEKHDDAYDSFMADRGVTTTRARWKARALKAEATIARLSEALAEAEKKGAEAERLAEFARGIIRDSAWQGCDLDGAEVQERALKAGLLRSEKFDPAVHEDVEGYVEPGMDWFLFSGPLAPPRDLSQGGQHG